MKQKTKIKKTVKKTFYEVFAPLTSTKIMLYAASPEELNDKTVKIDLTKSLRGKNLELKLRIKNENGSLTGLAESATLASSYVRKVVRKGTDYNEDSIAAQCRDMHVRIKPLLVTRRRVSKGILKTLRETARKHLLTYLKTRNAEEIFSEIIANKLQKQLAVKLKKIYPLALCEIRMFEILSPIKDSEREQTKEAPEDISQNTEE